MHPVPEYAMLQSDQEVNYLCSIKENKEYNMKFYRPKMIVVLRNCDPGGRLIDLKLSQSHLQVQPWILLRIRNFTIDGCVYKVPVCNYCNDCTDSMSQEQTHSLQSQLKHN